MRKPTQDEIDDLVLDICFNERNINPLDPKYEEELEDVERDVENSWLVVFDDYITDGPGYAGKVMLALWGGSPEFVSSYVWHGTEIKKVEIE